jgi:hypothetical protein
MHMKLKPTPAPSTPTAPPRLSPGALRALAKANAKLGRGAKTRFLLLEQIRVDGGTQMRAALDSEKVREYLEKIQGGTRFPAAVVFHDGATHWMADGFHRYATEAALGERWPMLECEVKAGTRRDAILYAAGANDAHGLPRSRADRERSVRTLLEDAEWSRWSDREIARQCKVHPKLVAEVKLDLPKRPAAPVMALRGGKPIVINVSGTAEATRTRAAVAKAAKESAAARRGAAEGIRMALDGLGAVMNPESAPAPIVEAKPSTVTVINRNPGNRETHRNSGVPADADRGAGVERARENLLAAMDAHLQPQIDAMIDAMQLALLAKVIGCPKDEARARLDAATLGELEAWLGSKRLKAGREAA